MTIVSVLYVSTSTLSDEDADRQVSEIVSIAQRRNILAELTGALLFTGSHFAQVLEGHPDDVDETLSSIRRDPRHRQLLCVDRSPLITRRFPDWSMAYSGPSPFVSGFVRRLLDAPSQQQRDLAATWLEDLMVKFAET